MRETVRQAIGKLAGAVREMHEAQQLAFVRRTALDRFADNPDAAPDTYSEFLTRTSGALLHEPSARKRARRAHQH